MALAEDKENVAPLSPSDPLQQKGTSPSPKKAGRKGRSKSIGPGGLDDVDEAKANKQDLKNRRKSTYVPATKPIISAEQERKERQAARRATLANRRVSFAPEATLHTWDVIEFMRDPTTSTDSSENTRRASNFTRSSAGGSPFKSSTAIDSDPPSTPPEQEDEPEELPSSPTHQRDLHQTKRRRSSAASSSPANTSSPAAPSGSSDVSDGEDEDADGSEDDTGTAMSLDADDTTLRSTSESTSSTGSSARLEAALRLAAEQAGTRGIEYDEYGDASMELAGDEITNAFKPWMDQQEAAEQPMGSASLDQENVNPFSPVFKAQMVSGLVRRPSTVHEEDTGDLSMNMTRAVGGVIRIEQPEESPSSQNGDGTMEFTQAVGKIQSTATTTAGQKRRRSTAETGSPAISAQAGRSKRRRSSAVRSSMGDETMDLTMAVGGIQTTGSPAKVERRKSVARRRSSGATSVQDEATMDFTQAVGSIRAGGEQTSSSLDENEELTMELTTVLGGIKAAERAAAEQRPTTPQTAQSPVRNAVNTTPKDQERFKDAPDSGPKKLLTPVFQKQVTRSDDQDTAEQSLERSASSGRRTRSSIAFKVATPETALSNRGGSKTTTPRSSPAKVVQSPYSRTPEGSPARRSSATPNSTARQQLDQQLNAVEPSPIAEKVQRSSPLKAASTPDKIASGSQDVRRLAESIKLLSTPRKETLKGVTPKKQPEQSPPKAATPRSRQTSKAGAPVHNSSQRQLSDDLKKLQEEGNASEKVPLQKFLDMAGIRFMDLTTTKRRMTTAPTPSKARKADDLLDEPAVTLEAAVVAGSCTVPELEMYEHACHELKRYISDGKRVIKDLESETVKETPALLQVYMSAPPARKLVLDSQMREIKTRARLGSKELWYAWRSQLLEDLMRGLQGVGEGLIGDDEKLGVVEQILENVMPGLREKYDELHAESETLERETSATTEEERQELEEARERIVAVDEELEEQKNILAELQREMQKQETIATDLEESRDEFTAAVKEAERVKEACRSVSTNEITALKDSISTLERTYGWTILSASSLPTPSLTLSYKSHLHLFLHPLAFNQQNSSPNAPISLHHTSTQPLPTTARFFLQLLRASLLALPQCQTRIRDLLGLVSQGWETALAVQELERRMNLETLTTARIASDEELVVAAEVLVREKRAKVRMEFAITASVVEEDEGLQVRKTVVPSVKVVYGEGLAGEEKKLNDFVKKRVGGNGAEFDGWETVVRVLTARLVSPSPSPHPQGIPVATTPAAEKGMKSRLARRR